MAAAIAGNSPGKLSSTKSLSLSIDNLLSLLTPSVMADQFLEMSMDLAASTSFCNNFIGWTAGTAGVGKEERLRFSATCELERMA